MRGILTWPTETDLVFLQGSNKLMLTVQSPLIRAVIQDSIERTRASLLFLNAFPNLFETLEYIEEALVSAAEQIKAAASIHRRLQGDHMYTINMSRVVSSSYIISLRVLMSYSASRAHFPFPQGCQGLLRGNCTG